MLVEKKDGDKYIIKIIKGNLLVTLIFILGFIIHFIIQKNNFGVLIVVFLIINGFKKQLFAFKRKPSNEELIKALETNESILLRDLNLEEAIETVGKQLEKEQRKYFVVVFEEAAIFYQQKSRWRSFLLKNNFYCLELRQNGIKLSTYSIRTPKLFEELAPLNGIQY